MARQLGFLLWLLAGFVLIPLLLFAITGRLYLSRSGINWLVILCVAYLPALFAYASICAFGHYVAGCAAGLKFRYMRLGALGITASSSGTVYQRVAPILSVGYHVLMYPRDGVYRPHRWATFLAGGLVAQIAILTIILVIDMRVGVPFLPVAGETSALQRELWWMTSVLAVVIAIGLNPFFRGSYVRRIFLLFHKKTALGMARQIALDGMLQSGQRARDWDVSLIDACISDAKSAPARMASNHLAYYIDWDSGKLEEALAHIRIAAAESVGLRGKESLRRIVLLEYAFALARIEENPIAAMKALGDADAVDSGTGTNARLRAEAAIALAAADYRSAVSKATAAREALLAKSKSVPPNVRAEVEWNEAIISEARRSSGSQFTSDPLARA